MILFIVVLVLGVNFTLWGTIGLLRIVDDRIFPRRVVDAAIPRARPTAALEVDRRRAVDPGPQRGTGARADGGVGGRPPPRGNVYVVSDGSDDATEAVAEQLGANVLRLEHGAREGVGADRGAAALPPRCPLQGGAAARRRHRAQPRLPHARAAAVRRPRCRRRGGRHDHRLAPARPIRRHSVPARPSRPRATS